MVRFALAAALLAGCGGDQKALDKARETWLREGSDTYTMTVVHTCFCPDTDPVEVEVVAGGVRSATIHAQDGDLVVEASEYRSWYTVDGLFDEIQAALDRGAHEVRVEYADKLGYPKDIYVDVEQLAVDDEYGWTITAIRLDPAGVGTGG